MLRASDDAHSIQSTLAVVGAAFSLAVFPGRELFGFGFRVTASVDARIATVTAVALIGLLAQRLTNGFDLLKSRELAGLFQETLLELRPTTNRRAIVDRVHLLAIERTFPRTFV